MKTRKGCLSAMSNCNHIVFGIITISHCVWYNNNISQFISCGIRYQHTTD